MRPPSSSPPLPVLALGLAAAAATAVAKITPGTFVDAGNTLVSAMMMFVGNENKVYILDKAEGNAATVNGHPAWGSVWDVQSHQAQVMDVRTNVFCSSGMHLPNGSYVTFGGNGAVGPGGNIGSQLNPGGFSAAWDGTYQDFDGTRAIRILNPCDDTDDFTAPQCQWFDEPTLLSMKSARWYSAAEATGDGTVVIIGGFTSGGYINRNLPNTDPATEGGAANPTYEFYPPAAGDPQRMNFMVATSGLNAYAHTFLMPSGKMFVQANLSSVLWDYNANIETPLPPMPKGVVRVYPASGAVAMLPLTPSNNYTPTILFCGGSDMPDESWGNYSFPFINTWEYPASNDCQRITPEPSDPTVQPQYTQDDDMLEGRTMGQFIILPTGQLLVINGGLNGTAGYSQATPLTPNFADMPFGESLASGPVGTPAVYDPEQPAGQRWSRAETWQGSKIPRLYHSSAMLLPDGSVLVAGSNPNVDVNLTTVFPTTYEAEIFYPSYFAAEVRPNVTSGMPGTLSYGGAPFDMVLGGKTYSGVSNDAADSTKVVLLRGGFTTHAMNMGQRYLQLNNTYTVQDNGDITLHVSQLPPNPNLFQPGPAFLYVVVNGVPSVGRYVIVGNGQIGSQSVAEVQALQGSVRDGTGKVRGGASGSSTSAGADGNTGSSNGGGNGNGDGEGKTNTGAVVGGVVAGVVLLGAVAGLLIARRRRRSPAPSSNLGFVPPPSNSAAEYPMTSAHTYATAASTPYGGSSAAFVPLAHESESAVSLSGGGYRDDPYLPSPSPNMGVYGRGSDGMGTSFDDPYTARPMQPAGNGGGGGGGGYGQGRRF